MRGQGGLAGESKPDLTSRINSPSLLPMPRPTWFVLAVALVCPSLGQAAGVAPWVAMDYGPTLTATLEVAPDNLAYKGLAVRLDEGPGGMAAGRKFMVFETDTLRMAAAWEGEGFIDWHNIAFDGGHNTHAKITGTRLFANPDAPGWSLGEADFKDDRFTGRDGKRYGPQPGARWKGHFLHGHQVVLSYEVGGHAIMELPGLEQDCFTRSFYLDPHRDALELQVARREGRPPRLIETPAGPVALFTAEATSTEHDQVFDGGTALMIANSGDVDWQARDVTIHARLRTRNDGTILAQAPDEGPWAPNGKTFFLRDGRPTFDIGWVGVVQARAKVNDGRWHEVTMTWAHERGEVRFYIDGQPDPAGPHPLKAKAPVENHSLRIGFSSPNFPNPSFFQGDIAEVRMFQRAFPPEAIPGLARQQDGLIGAWIMADANQGRVPDRSGHKRDGRIQTGNPGAGKPLELAVALVGGPDDLKWLTTPEGDLRLRCPATREGTRFKLLYLGAEQDAQGKLAKAMSNPLPLADPTPLVNGGPARWPETVTTRPTAIGNRQGPYQVESITLPDDNPYRAWMRLGGFDFFADGLRAAVCTWQGDVWIVDGLADTFSGFTWRRIASGLFQPLGLKVVNEQIYVTCRDQITRLHDLNGDGEADYYESFNHDAQVTEHFHEFAMDLQTDQDGNFYYAKGACHAREATIQQHGTLIRISPDGRHSEIVASGFRAPNGVCVSPDGSFIVSDQEGHWTPKNRINRVVPGGFYGYMSGWTEPDRDPEDFVPPLTWIHNTFDRSPAEQLWVTSDRWGLPEGSLISLSYGIGQILLVLPQAVGGRWQGGVVSMPIPDMPTGIMRGRVHSADGQLYVCGLVGWSSNKTRPGGFYRVRHTGRPLHMPTSMAARPEGVRLTFSEPLDPESAGDPESYAMERFQYKRQASYGSQDFKVSDPTQQGRDAVIITQATLSDENRTVTLHIPDMQPSMQVELRYRMRAADGARLDHTLQSTIHVIGE